METKSLDIFELKMDSTQEGVVIGYGSVFGNIDRGGDIVAKGAFTDSLASGRKPKMLFQHDPSDVIGVWTEATEDEKGLRVVGKLANTPKGNEVKELIKIGAIEGLSIGYRVIESDVDNESGARIIKQAELFEISVVSFPMNESAVIDQIKAASMTKREIEKKLRDAGFSKSVAATLLKGGFEAISNSQWDVDETYSKEAKEAEIKLAEIRELLNKRISILN